MTWETRSPEAVAESQEERFGRESRAEVESLDALQDMRRALIEANGRLLALYGPFGMFDDHRKRMVEAMKIQARMELSTPDGKKPTEAAIDAHAYGSEQYGRFLDNALSERIECLSVSAKLDELAERIRDRELGIQSYCKEIGLR